MDSKEITLSKICEIDKYFQTVFEAELLGFISRMSLVGPIETDTMRREFARKLEFSLEFGIKYCIELQTHKLVKPYAVRDLKLLEWRIVRDYKEFLVKTGQIKVSQLKTKKSPDNPWASGQGYLFHELFSRQTITVEDALVIAARQKKKLTEKRVMDLIEKYKKGDFPQWTVEETLVTEGDKSYTKYHLTKQEVKV